MSGRWNHATLVAGLALVVLVASLPALRTGFVGEDWRILVEADGEHPEVARVEAEREGPSVLGLGVRRLFELEGDGGSLVAGAWLAASRRAWGVRGDGWIDLEGAVGYRLESLAALLVAAAGAGLFLHRLLLPWTGSEHARAAGLAAAVLVPLHPLTVGAITSLAGRAELAAVAIGAFSCAAFLRGRQDRRFGLTFVAVLLAILAGFAGELAVFLPPVLCAAEYASAHRWRPRRVRRRTALTTFVVFGLAVAVEPLARWAWIGEGPSWFAHAEPGIADGLGAWAGAARELEKLGLLLLPVSAFGAGLFGTFLAGVLLLVALQPALLAARSAPRLWGWLAALWIAALVLSLVPGFGVDVSAEDLTRGRVLFGSAIAAAVGLGAASTAMSGARRVVLPAALVLGFGWLSQLNAAPWRRAAADAEELRIDLLNAQELHGWDVRMLVVEPFAEPRGVDPLAGALPWMLDARFAGGDPAPARARAQALDERAFLALCRAPELARMRSEEPVVVVVPLGALDVPSVGARPLRSGERDAILLPAPEPSTGPKRWSRDPRSPDLDLEALSESVLRVVVPPGTALDAPLKMSWRARSALASGGTELGVWLEEEGRAVAHFDLGGSLSWRLGDRIRRIWFEQGLAIDHAQVLDAPPRMRVDPAMISYHGDWVFDRLDPFDEKAPKPRGSYRLSLLDLETYEGVVLEGYYDHLGRVRIRGSARRAERLRGAGAFTVQRVVDGAVVESLQGRFPSDDAPIQ